MRRDTILRMANASGDATGTMESHIVTASTPLSPAVLWHIATYGPLDEISNHAGAVRHHIYWHGNRNEADGTLRKPMLFLIYQTSRHGPQNGFRLCLIREGFHICAATKSSTDVGDEIDELEKDIPPEHAEFVMVGPETTI